MGVAGDHIASSRTLEFEDAFRAASGGRGVDVVLNSLAGEYVDASLRLRFHSGRTFYGVGGGVWVPIGKNYDTPFFDPMPLIELHGGHTFRNSSTGAAPQIFFAAGGGWNGNGAILFANAGVGLRF